MEARATLNGSSVSKTFVAAVLVLVAMGLGAMGGYAVKGLSASGASTTSIGTVHPAAGTVLRQDNPPAAGQVRPAPGTVLRQDNPPAGAVVPAWIQNEIDGPQADPRLSQDDPAFIDKYAQKPSTDSNQGLGTRGDYGFLQ